MLFGEKSNHKNTPHSGGEGKGGLTATKGSSQIRYLKGPFFEPVARAMGWQDKKAP